MLQSIFLKNIKFVDRRILRLSDYFQSGCMRVCLWSSRSRLPRIEELYVFRLFLVLKTPNEKGRSELTMTYETANEIPTKHLTILELEPLTIEVF